MALSEHWMLLDLSGLNFKIEIVLQMLLYCQIMKSL
jgi:hypothetical protein